MRSGKSYFVYILGSLSGTLYIGVTSRPERRIFEHKQHLQEGFTSKYDVDRLLYYESYDEIGKAIGREKQLKRAAGEEDCADSGSESPVDRSQPGMVPDFDKRVGMLRLRPSGRKRPDRLRSA